METWDRMVATITIVMTAQWLLETNGFVEAAACTQDITDVCHYHRYFEDHMFWSAKAGNIENCVQSCVRLRKCKSINYQLTTTNCELNDASNLEKPEHLRRQYGFLYSNFDNWTSDVDPVCFSRPCAINEVCVPGSLLSLSGPNCQGYTCMDLNVRCPIPTGGTTPYTSLTRRYVGDTVTFTCQQGYHGNTATCLPSGEWSDEIKEPCEVVYMSNCTSDAKCTGIQGECTDGRCRCVYNQVFDEEAASCSSRFRLVDGDGDAYTGRLEILRDGNWSTVCKDGFNPAAVEVACRTLGFQFSGSIHENTYGTGTGVTYQLAGLHCAGSESTLFDCTITEFKKDHCDHSKDIGLTCYSKQMGSDDLRIVATDGSVGPEVMEGRPEVLYNGSWGTINDFDWDIDDVNAFCKTVNSTWRGEAEFLNSAKGAGNGTVWLSGLKCNSGDDNIFECQHDGWNKCVGSDCNHSNDAGLKCTE